MHQLFLDLSIEAGAAILRHFAAGVESQTKGDGSPVTLADQEAESIILKGLEGAYLDIPVVAEEAVAAGEIPADLGKKFILVDPLDGTREFINGRSDFTVNIALVENGVPTIGAVYAPAKGEIFWSDGTASYKALVQDGEMGASQPIRVRAKPEVPVIVASRSHKDAETEAYCAAQGPHELVSAGSSLKFCLLAEGKADLYPRFGPTMQWDTGAGHAVLKGAGGTVTKTDGSPFSYGRIAHEGKLFLNPGFLATSEA